MNAPREQRILLGIGFMLIAASILPIMNGFGQMLSQAYPSAQVVWARISGQFLLMLAFLLPVAGWRALRTRMPGWQLGRSAAQLGSTLCYFTAIAYVPLAKATAISFLAPFVTALLAWPLLGERPGLRRMACITVAFLGVLVVIRPGMAGFEPVLLLLVAGATANAIYQTLTRKVAPHDRPETSTLWSALLGTVVLTLAAPFFLVVPMSAMDVLLFLALGVMGGAGHYCIARAFTYGPAAVIAPFQYAQLIGSILMGLAIDGLWPDGGTWLGAAIIIGAGVWLAVSEARRPR